MIDINCTPRAKGGWTEEETRTLFDEAMLADSEGRSIKSVFDRISEVTGRKPNSIRNYYYLKLRERGMSPKMAFTPFDEEEVELLVCSMLTGQAQGKSVRGIALEMANGDKKGMLRYHNKYRSMLKSDPGYVTSLVERLQAEGTPCRDPFAYNRRELKDVSIIISELTQNLNDAGIDVSELLMSLNELAAAAKQDARLTQELGSAMRENGELEARLSRLTALNRGFIEMDGIERIAGLKDYVAAVEAAITN